VRRRQIFDKSLERSAKDAAKLESGTVRFWFRRKYNLPPSDDRYLDMTEEAMLTEYWAHFYYEKPESVFEDGTDNFEEELAAMDAEMGIPPDDDFEDISHG
jgi:hypothetical protein